MSEAPETTVAETRAPRMEEIVPDTPEVRKTREEAEKNGLDYQVKELVEQGRKHRTEKWVDKKTGEVVVARSMTSLDLNAPEFEREAKKLLEFDHPATSKAIGFIHQKGDKPATLLTACEPGTLAGLLASPEKFSSTHRAKVLTGVAASIKYLHERKHVHGALRPSNIGIDLEGNPRVLLGLRSMAEGLQDAWVTPESLTEGKIIPAGDVYALGLLAYVLIADKPVFDPELKPFPLAEAIVSGKRPAIPDEVPPGLATLILRSWDVNPEARPTAAEFLQILSEQGYKLKPDVDEVSVRKYAARFFDGAQPGEERDAAESRILTQTREELREHRALLAGLEQRAKMLEFENLQLARAGAAGDRAIEVLASKILALERAVTELKNAAPAS